MTTESIESRQPAHRGLWTFLLAALAVVPMFVSGSAAAQQQGGGPVSTGTVSLSEPFVNAFGWRVGAVTLSAEKDCQDDCNCTFAGDVTLEETLPIQECDILQVQIFKIVCGFDESCPNGVRWGEKAVITYECCISVPPFGSYLCNTYTSELKACGN